ncbi:MAG TPA: DUF2946 family protein [Usitatibacter sp.]|nr:DUF2946 family protein [Usitatibacter sp.]
MRPRQRLYAFIAALAVVFGALWPLVSQARFGPPAVPSFICSQSAFHHPGAPPQHEDKSHCPLCVVGADFTPPAVAQAMVPSHLGVATVAAAGIASSQPAFLARPPPSRAPPQHS